MKYILYVTFIFLLASCNFFGEKEISTVVEPKEVTTETVKEKELVSDGEKIENQALFPALEKIQDEGLREQVKKIHTDNSLTVDEKVEKIQLLLSKKTEVGEGEDKQQEKSKDAIAKTQENQNNVQKEVVKQVATEVEPSAMIKQNSDGQFCVLGTCTPKSLKLEETEKGVYKGVDKQGEDKKTTYIVDKNKQVFSIDASEVFLLETTTFSKLKGNIVKTKYTGGCGSSKITQTILSNTGKVINVSPKYFSNILIGNIEYVPELQIKEEEYSLTNPNGAYYGEKRFASESELKDFILSKMKETYSLRQRYQVYFSKYPNITVLYKARNYEKQSDRVYFSNKSLTTDGAGNLLDLAATNEMVKQYSQDFQGSGLFKKSDKERSDDRVAESVTAEDLPVFTVKKVGDDHGKNMYLVSTASNYKIQPFAELCKPLVYYYAKQPETNTLTLKKQNQDRFTKLIPSFTRATSWDFASNNGKITVEDKIYDYLYYSLENVGYTPNKYGWIVNGSDIEVFFQDKLTKMNFLESEKQDFISYWKDKYKDEKYYFVSFKYKKELDEIIKLSFSKAPTNEFRVLLDSYELDTFTSKQKYFLYDTQKPHKFDLGIIQRFDRGNSAREVFEWGGVLQTPEKTYIK